MTDHCGGTGPAPSGPSPDSPADTSAPPVAPSASPPPAPRAEPVVEARDLVKSYGPTAALRGVSVAAAPGEVLAITGPSGSGKSTLLHCLAGIVVPDAGEVRFAGTRVDTLDETARTLLRRDDFGIVFQFAQLIPELTALENVALPGLLRRSGRAAAFDAARRWLDRVGAAGLGESRAAELSGGQLQRVALARALSGEPRVLFADEPTGALDSLGGERLLGLLVELAAERRLTVVLVTHDNQVAAYAHREIVLRDGRVQTPVVA